MKRAVVTLIAGISGFAAGFLIAPEPGAVSPGPNLAGKASDRWGGPTGKGLSRLEQLAAMAATLSRSEWPVFFRARLHSPEETRLAAELWAEADPAGFWEWLRESRDRDQLERFGTDLLKRWSEQDPEAAMAAAMAVSDAGLGESFRRTVVEAVLERDTAMGLDLVARVWDLPASNHGQRPWIMRDPALAARGLAGLPVTHDYRKFLIHAVPAWAEKDPEACLAWLRETPPIEKTQWPWNWVVRGFLEVAQTDPDGALRAARELADPAHRSQALAGVIASGKLSPGEAAPWLDQIRLDERFILSEELIGSLRNLKGDLAHRAGVLSLLPGNRNSVDDYQRLSREWSQEDPAAAWEWALSIDDPALSRSAVSAAIDHIDVGQLDAIAEIPFSSLSNALLRKAVARLPEDQRKAWLAKMPADRAAWARRIAGPP
jgi:hypothetical protein